MHGFTHLHLHTQYSLLDGACMMGRLLDRLEALGHTSCAITDHGVMYGVVDFYQQCKKRGIHPVIGSEVYVCQNMNDKTSGGRDYGHLILLCENQRGYENLCKLVSEGFVRGFYYKPRVDYDLLAQYSEGLIALSACLSGDIPKLLLAGQEEQAYAMAGKYRQIFGKDNFFIELQDHGIPEQKQVLPQLIKLAHAMNIPMVITNDCHYIEQSDAQAQEVLMCIQTGKTMSDENRMRMSTDHLYVKSEEEMRKHFPDFDEAFENTGKIAERCQVEFDFNARHLPHYPLEEGQEASALLRTLCNEGLDKLYPSDRKDARQRLDYELSVIESMGFVDYFLIVWDFIKYAKDNGILVGPGRGSGAGSIVAYSLGITSIDPLKYNLLFERFLNPERISMPDLDIDFDYERRGEVIDYVARRYGHDHVAQIITFGTMAAKAVLRDVGRVLDMSYQEVDAVAKMVPFALDMTLDKALVASKELASAYETDERVKALFDTAKKLEGMPRHASTHAAGVLITSNPVSDYVPLQTNEEVITTQFPMGTLEALGLLKMDFLGLRTLTVIGDSLKMAEQMGAKPMTPEEIPLDDPAVYQMICAGDTDGIFQLESSGMRSFLMAMKPSCFEDIIAGISLYRPGPMDSIPRYIAGKNDPNSVKYLDPALKPILDVTYGCMVYQEQVMQIVRDLAGYSLGRSDLVRRAMSKKKHDVMEKEKEYFIHGKMGDDGTVEVEGAVRRGVPEAVAERIFEEMTAFASYAFNKSHAAAYGVIAVQTAWLKVHHPVAFMAALMNSVTGNADKVAYYIQYCRRKSITVLPPDINRSQERFSVDGDGIRFGLNAVKNVGKGAIRAIKDEIAEGGPYRDLFDFLERLSDAAVNKKAVDSLIRAGALDSLPGLRAQKLEIFESVMDGAARAGKKQVQGQMSLFGEELGADLDVPRPQLPDREEYDWRKMLSMEREMTGVYISGHPLDEYADKLSKLPVNYQTLSELAEASDHGLSQDQMQVAMGGLIVDKRTKTTRNGGVMGFVQLEDLYGITEVLAFPRVWERLGNQLVVDSAVILTGKLSIREDEAPKLLLDSVRSLDAPEPTQSSAAGYREEYVHTYNQEDRRNDWAMSNVYEEKAASKPDDESDLPEQMRGRPLYPNLGAPDSRKLFLWLKDYDQREDVAKILMPTPGMIRVIFAIGEEKQRENAPRNLWVGSDVGLDALTQLLGTGRVVLK